MTTVAITLGTESRRREALTGWWNHQSHWDQEPALHWGEHGSRSHTQVIVLKGHTGAGAGGNRMASTRVRLIPSTTLASDLSDCLDTEEAKTAMAWLDRASIADRSAQLMLAPKCSGKFS